MRPYGLMADLHAHNWSAFAHVGADGVNSRLTRLINEIGHCVKEVRAAGGDKIIIAGDVFHVRGSIAPSVLNPMLDVFKKIVSDGMGVRILAGNHDLEGKESNRIGSAITALEGVGCKVINTFHQGLTADERIVMIPWTPNIADLKALIEKARDSDPNPGEIDLILHAPIDGVIPGLPDHGLTAAFLAGMGFRRVFSGHYHHHKELEDGVAGEVYSIGALNHNTWSDVGSKAGFLIVSDGGVKWHKSHAPEFVEITGETDPAEVPLIVDGNYVRAKINSTKQRDVEELRGYLLECGAKGVVILSQKEVTESKRAGTPSIAAGASLEVSVADFIKAQSYANPEALAVLCHDILTEARSAA